MEELEREWKTFREKLKNWVRPYIKFVIKRLDETVNIDASRYIAVGMFAIFYIYEALVKQLMVMFWWQSGLLILFVFIGLLIWDWKKSFSFDE